MRRYIAQRLGYMIVTFFIIASLTFFMMQALPGSPFKNEEKLSEQQKEILYDKYGLNDPLPQRYVSYMSDLVQGDLGISFQYDNRPVNKIIVQRIGPSAVLGFEAIVFGTIIGIFLGAIAALKHNTFLDYGSMMLAVLGLSIPSFIFAGLMQYFVGVKLGWLPVAFWEGPAHHVMPAISLSTIVIATVARFMRTEMLEVLSQDYITTAKAKGISNAAVIMKHSLRNAMIPVITMLGPLAVAIMTGSLVIEKIFSVPGIGEQFVLAIQTNDYPMIMGVTLFYSLLFIVIVFIVDLLYGVIDPRIRLAGGKTK